MDVDFVESFRDVPPDTWARLAEQAGLIFATREWLETWWDHYGGGRRRLIGLVQRDGAVVAIVPLYFWKSRGVPVLRFIGHGQGDELGPVSAPLTNSGAVAAVAAAVDRLPLRRYLLLAEQMRGDGRFGELAGAHELYRQSSLVLQPPGGTWDSFVQSRGRNFRQQIRRFPRKLSESGDVVYRLSNDPRRLQDDLETLFRLHEMRWRSPDTPFLNASSFHRDFALVACRKGWLRLWILDVNGEPAAASYGFRFTGRESFYQVGRDPRLHRQNVGFVLLAHNIEAALDDGVKECRLLRGDSDYKFRFATSDRGIRTFGVPRGVAARFALRAADALGGRSLGLERRVMG
jgi:CelD/BcsL family acetyltransferase involved in cellulose biosynthesis